MTLVRHLIPPADETTSLTVEFLAALQNADPD